MTLYGLDLWAAALLFARVGALVMLLPGLGEPAIPATARLVLALAVTALLAPALGGGFAPAPTQLGAAVGMLIGEILIGLSIGLIARILVSALATAGQIAGLETGLAFAQTSDPTFNETGQIFAVFFSVLGVALVFATDLHHGFLRAISGSYALFAPGAPIEVAAWSEAAVGAVGDSFRIALQISAPLLLAGIVYRVGLGVLSRVIPQIQVFFIALPLNVMGGFLVMGLALSAGMLVWLDRMGRFALSLE